MDQIIDITTDGRHLSRDRGFLKVSENGLEIGRTPLDQIAAVIVHAHGTTWSTSVLAELAERGAPVVLCGTNHVPRSVLLPIEGHYAQGARMRAQWHAKAPLKKQAWKKIVIAKVRMQAQVLSAAGQPRVRLDQLARNVTSGDRTNVEAQAARYYWPLLMGKQFRRDTGGSGLNALLNYGYTVLRSATARAVVSAGLHPTIGLHHSNRSNAFALADDLMEPFRPLVDCTVRNIARRSGDAVDITAKQALAKLIAVDLPLGSSVTPVSVALIKLATAVGQSFETGKLALALPDPPDPLTLMGLGL
ncbi:MAG: type II CRISPR-associated endonuclease Cas1 [Rhodobacteraceae bacterium]|nr:type II CRISPR-associated endonuclease Cas1 [Paracoccaceae bacterium]MCY4141390.1 type II CRISPR-associated endonuclease Cas1 [Paracoccaceae bacterium]